MKGGVYIAKNYALCYVQTINWTGILTSKESNQKLIVRYNANSSTCGKYITYDMKQYIECWDVKQYCMTVNIKSIGPEVLQEDLKCALKYLTKQNEN